MRYLQKLQPFAVFSPKYLDRCADALDTAIIDVPAYAAWRPLDPGPSCNIDERYAQLPPLTKADIRRHGAEGFVPRGMNVHDGLERGEIEYVSTSGTTDEKVQNLWNQSWWDASERASWLLNSRAAQVVTSGHREAILTSALCVGFPSEKDPLPFEQRQSGRFLYLNEYWNPLSWTPALLDRMIDELEVFKPQVLEGNPTMLAILSRRIAQRGLRINGPAFIVLTYEYASRLHYRDIRSAFSAPIASSYGSTETGYVFMECEAGRYHQNTEFCRVDFQQLRSAPGRVGRIFVTTFGNPWYRLVRFDVGDLVTLSSDPCPCGRREGLTLDNIAGRTKNLLFDTRGRPVTTDEIDAQVSGIDNLLHYQVVQSDPETYRVTFTCSGDPDAYGAAIEQALRTRLGATVTITVRHEDTIPPDPPGKYRLTRSAVEVDERELFLTKEAR